MADYRMVCPWDNIDPEAYMQCPYDKTHMVMAERFTRHLKKCIKSHKGRDFVTCPFHSWHVMKRPMLHHHMSECPFGKIQELDLTRVAKYRSCGDVERGRIDAIDYKDFPVPQTECWDDAPNNRASDEAGRRCLVNTDYKEFHVPQTECWDDDEEREANGKPGAFKQGGTNLYTKFQNSTK